MYDVRRKHSIAAEQTSFEGAEGFHMLVILFALPELAFLIRASVFVIVR